MQVETEETQQPRLPLLLDQRKRDCCDHDRKGEGVQRVMVAGKPQQRVL